MSNIKKQKHTTRKHSIHRKEKNEQKTILEKVETLNLVDKRLHLSVTYSESEMKPLAKGNKVSNVSDYELRNRNCYRNQIQS